MRIIRILGLQDELDFLQDAILPFCSDMMRTLRSALSGSGLPSTRQMDARKQVQPKATKTVKGL